MASHRQTLLETARQFCDAFADKKPLDEMFSYFSSSEDVMAFEHGLPQLAPFLGREFRGQKGLKEYFDLLSSTLSYENMAFSHLFVDPEVSKVSVRGRATFTWTRTGQSWHEVFTYVLEFDDDIKVKTYEIWADSGAAYLASRAELKEASR